MTVTRRAISGLRSNALTTNFKTADESFPPLYATTIGPAHLVRTPTISWIVSVIMYPNLLQ
jgi:hypothetical protein